MPTFGIDQGDIEWDVPAHAWAAPNYCAAAPVPRNGCRAATSRTPFPAPAYCIYCHARIGRQRNVYSTDDPNLCTFFAAYFRAPTTGAARAILERDVLRRNHGLRELPPPPPFQPVNQLRPKWWIGHTPPSGPVSRRRFNAVSLPESATGVLMRSHRVWSLSLISPSLIVLGGS
ncbi:hypothetical protein CcaverHIS002_0606460 [Cutaneotrichosporon cavernicola]|nr:hypothetical protein CcaverHIS002_0606460 [Cutaneotrichosporon cavernicola]